MTLVIAHRGASAYAPENTRAAYELAIRQRADMIEIDLHRTRDGAIVVTHDEELSALGGRGAIADASLQDVRALDAGGGESVPTLDEVLDAFGARIPFNLEIKSGACGDYPGLEQAALDAVSRRGLLERTLFSSFSDEALARLRERSASARIGLLVSPRHPERPVERAKALGAEAVHPWKGLASAEWIAAARAGGLAVHVFTVDEADEVRRLLDLGVDGLFTNHPDRVRALRDAPRESGPPLRTD